MITSTPSVSGSSFCVLKFIAVIDLEMVLGLEIPLLPLQISLCYRVLRFGEFNHQYSSPLEGFRLSQVYYLHAQFGDLLDQRLLSFFLDLQVLIEFHVAAQR